MESEAKLLLDTIESLRAGTGELEEICKDLTHLAEDPELFDRAVVHAQFTIWMTLGDKGFIREGYHQAFDAVEYHLFPDRRKKEVVEDDTDLEHITDFWYC